MKHACAKEGCSAVICLDDAIEVRMRKTHEWFQCPFGHSQRFIEQTEEEALISSLKKWTQYLEESEDRMREQLRSFQRCMWPGCSNRYAYEHPKNLWTHMVVKHGVPKLAEVKRAKKAG